MKKFIAVRSTPLVKVGQMMVAEEVGELLFLCELQQRVGHTVLRQTSMVGIPFSDLAFDIVEMGFTIPLRAPVPHPTDTVYEQRELEHELGDIIDEEVERRTREADPSYKEKGGVALPNKGIEHGKSPKPVGEE